MKVYNRILLPLLALLVMPVHSFAAKQGVTVVDAGLDGDQRYYRVICPSGKQGSVVHFYQTGKICMYPAAGKEKCLDKWDIDEAAREACK